MWSFCRKHREGLIVGGIMLLVAIVFVFVFSLSTSPLYSDDYYTFGGVYDGGDSLHFQTDGMNWANGKLPYRDGFDHKGPIIFLINALGWKLGGNSRYGIMIFQVIALTITLIYVWKISQLAKKSNLWGGISVTLTLVFMTSCYVLGNSVQEYNLPFLAVAIYYLVKYLYKEKSGKHNPRYALIYGIAIGACLLLQVTHAIPVCAGILVIMCVLIGRKDWKNLWQNLLFGMCGILIMWVPFALYFLVNGALGDFIFCTIVYNLSYARHIGSWLHGMGGGNMRYFLVTFVPFFCAALAAILAFARGRKPYAAMLAITFLLEAYLFFSAESYAQYVLPTIFQLGLLLNEIILFEHRDEARRFAYVGMISVIFLMAYNQVLDRASLLVSDYNLIRESKIHGVGYENLMDKYLDKIKESSFSAYGNNSLKGLYVRYNVVPFNKFFTIQDWCASFDDRIANETREDFRNHHSEYLLIDNGILKVPENGIKEVIDENYKLLGSENNYSMYQLKDRV